MAQAQQNVSITAPGFAGLDTQDSPLDMDPSFASAANNCVIDKFGRIASRKGFNFLTTNPDTAGILDGNPVVSMGEFIDEVDGTPYLFVTANNKIFIQETTGALELVEMTLPVLPAPYVITANNWQMVQLNNKFFFVQKGHEPLVFDPAGVTHMPADDTMLYLWDELPTHFAGSNYPNAAHAAFGRLWISDHDNNTTLVGWSSILDGEDWTAGGNGTLQTSEYWPSGFDEVTALAAHNNFMIIFGLNNILVYSTNSDVINTLTLVDTIEGIGCIARDSVVPTGTDYLFMDATGVRSLNRTIQEKSIPIGDISKNVRQDFQEALSLEPLDDIKGVYHHEDNFYACFLPSNPQTFVFDTWNPLPDGSARATIWDQLRPRVATRTRDRVTYFAGTGGVYTYEGSADVFLDEDNSFVETTVSIPMEYFTHPMDFGSPSQLLFPKQVDVTVFGGLNGQLGISWGFDYGEANNRKVLPLETVSEGFQWDTDTEWNDPEAFPGNVGVLGEWTSQAEALNQLKYNIWGSGRNLKVGFDTDILGSSVSIQELNIQVTQGRIL